MVSIYPIQGYHLEKKVASMFLKSILNLTVLLSLSSLSLTSVADDDGTFTYVLDPDARATLTGCVSTCPTELVIPELYNGSRVVAIGERAFNRLPIESVELPTGLVKIGPFAFRGGYLTELTLPDSIEEIGEYAFWQNPLSAVILPSGLKTIGVAVFANNRLTSIELPDTIETISELAFYQNQLQSLVLPNSTKVIGARAFEGNQIARIDLPNGLQRIETYAFWYNAVEELVLPSGLELLGEGAFANNPITKVDLGDLKEIGAYAFYSNRITELELSANVTTIGDYAFSENQIEELIIPVSVMELGRYAFWKNGLRTLEIKSESINLLKEAVFADNLLQTLFLPASIVALGQYALRTNALERLHFLGARPSFGFESLAKNQNLAVITYCSDMSGWPGASIEGITPVADCDGDGVEDTSDAFPLDATETADSDADGVGDNSDAFPNDATESIDSDSDSVGDNADNCPSLSNTDQLNTDGDTEGDACDSDDDNDGFSDDQEELDGTNPKSRFSCKSGCFSFDVDENLEAQPLTDGLLVIRHLFGFSGDSLISGAVSGDASRDGSDAIASYLTDADSQLDIDGDGESKPLTDGLLLIRYLFGFSGDSLISGAIGDGAERDTAEEVEAYIMERVPVQ